MLCDSGFMKVLIVDDFFIGGGAETVARATKALLHEKGYDSRFFFGSENMTKPDSVLAYLYSRRNRKLLAAELDSFKPDIIHIHNYYHILSSSLLYVIRKYKQSRKAGVIYTAHDFHLISPSSNLLYYKNGPKRLDIENLLAAQRFKVIDRRGHLHSVLKKTQWLFEKVFFRPENLFDRIICPSGFLENLFRKNGIKNKMIVIRNPLDVESKDELQFQVFYESKREENLRFVFFGRLSEEKGLKGFLDNIKELNRNIYLDFYGEGPIKEELELFAIDNEMLNVRFLGFLDFKELEVRLGEYDVAVLPSVGFENAPLVVPESAAKGLVVFGSNLGGVKEMCDLCNVPHFLYEPSDRDEFYSSYSGLVSFFANSSEKLISLNEFSKGHYVSTLVSLYDAVLSE